MARKNPPAYNPGPGLGDPNWPGLKPNYPPKLPPKTPPKLPPQPAIGEETTGGENIVSGGEASGGEAS